MWKPGDRLTHRFNPDLGPGRVVSTQGRRISVEFPDAGVTLSLAADSDALQPLVLQPGTRAIWTPTGETVVVERTIEDGAAILSDGRSAPAGELWPLALEQPLFERLARGEVDPVEAFAIRLDALHLAAIRETSGFGSFLGGRVHLYPHQLYAAEKAARGDPVRWLLADEVGLGKTVEACLILNHLIQTGRADRALIVAPETLTVQWLGEMWRKYHQVFVLLDNARLADVVRDYGPGFNPFDAYRRVVIGLDTLVENPRLSERAVDAGIDLLIVDEAHRLQRPPGHSGNPAYRAVAPIAALGRHVLLLTATPLEDDAHGFFRLIQILRPEEFPEEIPLEERLERRTQLPPCTSSTRRSDIGGFPPRVPLPIAVDDPSGWEAMARLESAIRSLPAADPVARRKKAGLIRLAMASGAALDATLGSADEVLRSLARAWTAADPRTAWLVDRLKKEWRETGGKTLVFVAHRETLEILRSTMSRATGSRVGIFHEDLSPAQRDIEVARFRIDGGPAILVSTECGGEGRNFEFCDRIVLFDLPWDPTVVEQRIGRLDRIGRRQPVPILYFRPPSGLGAAIVRLFEAIGIFEEPLAGLERELSHVEDAIEREALSDLAEIPPGHFEDVVLEAREASDRVRAAAYHELLRDPYRREMAEDILSRVPADLEELTAEVVLAECERLGFRLEPKSGRATWSIEFGNSALVDHLPGVPGGSSFLGTFDRTTAVEDETIDFFASGHSLVEGILAHIGESLQGRVTLLSLEGDEELPSGSGLLAIYKDGPRFEAVAVDTSGQVRPEWARRLTRRPLRTRRVRAEAWTSQPGWREAIERLAGSIRRPGRPVALAAFRIGE